AVEIGFGAFQALLHLLANDPEPRALATDGGGGGYVGWALSQITIGLGRGISLLIFAVLLLAGLVLALGIRGQHVMRALSWLSEQLERALERVDTLFPESAPA